MPDKIEQQNSNVTDTQSEKIRYGAPDGPRKNRRENYDGREPLEYLGHEAVASFLAFPKELREFKSVAALAKHFNVARKTIYCWMKDIDVLKRADWLSETNKIIGKLVVRRACPGMSEKLVEMGMGGNISAIKLWAEITLREDKQQEKSPLSPSSLEEVLERAEIIYEKHAEMMTPTWLKERAKRLGYGHPPEASDVSEPEIKQGPGSVAVNPCDACGTTRCAHGRCPACDICEVCK